MDGETKIPREPSSQLKSVFVTVGTTHFEELIRIVSSQSFLEMLGKCGYNKLVLQTGSGVTVQKRDALSGIQVHSYDYKKSIHEDIVNSSLVISHAGAGSVLEVLRARRPLIVVINESLMDNHQFELAEAFHKMNNLYYCTCSSLESTVMEKDLEKLEKYKEGRPEVFGSYLAEFMGLSNEKTEE